VAFDHNQFNQERDHITSLASMTESTWSFSQTFAQQFQTSSSGLLLAIVVSFPYIKDLNRPGITHLFG
jgi:hypothetical protein